MGDVFIKMNSQDYTKWNLPEGASASLGKGSITGNIVYSPDGTQLVVPSSTGIWIYDARTLKELSLITEHRGFDPSVAGFRSDGSLLAVGTLLSNWDGNPGYTILWDEHTKGQQLIDGGFSKLRSLTLSPNNKIIAGIDEKKRVYLADVQTEDCWFKEYEEISSPLAFSPDSRSLADAREDGTIQLWNATTGKPLRNLTEKPTEFLPMEELPDGRPTGVQAQGFSFLIFSPDSKMIAGASTLIHFPQVVISGIIWLWDASTGHIKSTFHAPDLSEFGIIGAIVPEIGWAIKEVVTSLAFSLNSRIFAIGTYGVKSNQAGYATAAIQLYNIHTGERKFYSTRHTAPICSMVFSPDGRTLTSAGIDGTILLWDVDIDQNESIPVKTPDEASILSLNISTRGSKIDPEADRTQLTNHQLKIKQICDEHKITTLCHFTRVENLQGILQEGLIGRSLLEEREQDFLYNDDDRADGHKEAVCLSISFPNYQMFYKRRRQEEKTKGLDDSQWIILFLEAKVLWELDCAFCQNNAARKTVSRTSLEARKRPEALKGMFEDFYNIKHQDLGIPQNYTTHPQAEVLVFSSISIQYIMDIHFWNEASQRTWLPTNIVADYKTSTNRQYFEPRSDYEIWRPANFNNEGIPRSYFNSDDNDNEIDRHSDINDDDIPF